MVRLRRRHGDARNHPRPRARRRALLRERVRQHHQTSPTTSARCAPPAATIIVDDVFYFVETPFQDGQAPGIVSNSNGGVVIQAVKDVTASGALYFSSAGNSGNFNDGTSGAWEGDFVDGGPTAALVPAGRLHNFGGQNFNLCASPSPTRRSRCTGPIRSGGSSNDYDLFRLNCRAPPLLASSTNIQNGTQDPIEQISQHARPPAAHRHRQEDKRRSRVSSISTNRGRLQFATAGETHGHAAVDAVGAFGVAAATPPRGRTRTRSAPRTRSRRSARTARAGFSSKRTARRSRRATSRPPVARCCRSRTSPRRTACR